MMWLRLTVAVLAVIIWRQNKMHSKTLSAPVEVCWCETQLLLTAAR